MLITTGCGNNATPGKNPEPEIVDQEPTSDPALESYIFTRHRFIPQNENISSGSSEEEKLNFASKYYLSTTAFMRDKINEFNQKNRNCPSENNFLRDIEIWVNPRDDQELGVNIREEFRDLAKCYGNIWYRLPNNHAIQEFEACNDWLSLRAYNDSLGQKKDSLDFPANQERAEIEERLAKYNIDIDNHTIETYTAELLKQAANGDQDLYQLLIDTVNLRLLTVGEHAVYDHGQNANLLLNRSNKVIMKPPGAASYCTPTKFNRQTSQTYMSFPVKKNINQNQEQESSR